MVIDSCESSSESKEDGFEHILNDNLVLDGGDEDMLSIEPASPNSLSDSITGFKNEIPCSGSPTISSLLSKRVVLNTTNSSALNLLLLGKNWKKCTLAIRTCFFASSFTLFNQTLLENSIISVQYRCYF